MVFLVFCVQFRANVRNLNEIISRRISVKDQELILLYVCTNLPGYYQNHKLLVHGCIVCGMACLFVTSHSYINVDYHK